ncbi:MAG: hypothetical protein WCZ47_00175 [Bacilli bacterium]
MFEGIGLDPALLNFHTPNLGHEFALLLDALNDIQELTSILDPYQGDDGIDEDFIGDLLEDISAKHEPIAHLLDTFYLSNIINEKDENGTLIHGDDSNFFGVINYMFDTMLESAGLTNKVSLNSIPKWANSRTYQGDFRRNINGEPIYDGENGYLVLFIKAIGESRLLDIIDVGEGVSIDFGALGGAVRHVFDAVERSKVISATFGDVLDKYILNTLSDDPGDVSFNNVTNWANEGETFERLCYALEDFGGIDFTNIDFMGSVPNNVVELLTALSDSQMFDGPDGYLFGDFFYDTLTSSLGDNLDLFHDPNATTTTKLKEDFDSLDTRPLWHEEIERFGEVIEALQGANVDENGDPIDTSEDPDYLGLLTSGNLTTTNVSNILTSLNNATTMRMVIYNGYAKIGSSFQSDQVNLSTMNNIPLIYMGKDKRQNEIDILVSMYDVINQLGTKDPITGEYDYDMNLKTTGVALVDSLRVSLKQLTGSLVFNTLVDNSPPEDETVFRQFTRVFVSAQVVKTNIYDDKNPKDIDGKANGYYQDNEEKIDYLLNSNFPIPTINLDYELDFVVNKDQEKQKQYVDEMLDVFETLINLDETDGDPYTPDGFDLDLNILNQANFQNLFKALNNSEIYFDLVPNLIARVVHNESAYQIQDIDIMAANPYFHYNGNEFDNHFPDGEIEELSDLFVLIKDFTNLIPSGEVDLSLLSNNIDLFKDTLIKFQETETFHRGGSHLPNEITVFQQIMRKIYLDTYLADLAFEQVHDFNIDAISVKDAIYKNLTDDIVNFELYSDPLYGPSLHLGSWPNEIEALGNLVENLTAINIVSSNLSSFDASIWTPSVLDGILNAINELDVVKDAAPHLIKNALYNEAINFSRFTTDKVANYIIDSTTFVGLLNEVTLSDGSENFTFEGNDVTSSGGKLHFTASGTLYNTTPITNIDSLLIKTNNLNDFTFYYGDTAQPDERFYFVEAVSGGYYKVNLSEVPYQYFQIKANAAFTVEEIKIKQAIEIGDYMQGQVSYRDVNIPILISLLEEMYDNTTEDYFDFSTLEGALKFVNEGKTLAPVLSFIVESDLYQKQIDPNYKAGALLFYNLFSFEFNQVVAGETISIDAALAENIRGATLKDKLSKINDLVNVDSGGKFDCLNEGFALDYGFFSLAFFEAAKQIPTNKMPGYFSFEDMYLYNIANYDGGANHLKVALESSHLGRNRNGVVVDFIVDGYGPALLTSEIVAGQLNAILNSRYTYLDLEGIAYTPVDLYTNEYETLVDKDEILGFTSAINALHYSLNDLIVPNGMITAIDISDAFTNMFDQDLAFIIYLADIEPPLNGSILTGGRNLGVTPNPTTLSDFNDIAQALITQRGL